MMGQTSLLMRVFQAWDVWTTYRTGAFFYGWSNVIAAGMLADSSEAEASTADA